MDDVINNFGKALEYLEKGVAALRPINATAANGISRSVNDLSRQVVGVVVDHGIIPDQPSDLHLTSATTLTTTTTTPQVPPGFEGLSHLTAQLTSYDVMPGPSASSLAAEASSASSFHNQQASQNQAGEFPTSGGAQLSSSNPGPSSLGTSSGPSWATIAAMNADRTQFPNPSARSFNYELSRVSAGIHEGPLMSISFTEDDISGARACCVIFQRAEHASAFVLMHHQRLVEGRPSFFHGEHVALGEPYPMNHDIVLMGPPTNYRRRLTVVGKALFMDLTGRRFVVDLCRMVGRDNIERVHLYNSGNAMVVLGSIRAAIAVLSAIQSFSAQQGPYQGCLVSFSKDPCETELRLIAAQGSGTLI
ncbi:MAG: Cytochrome c oxidase subunit 4 [Chaenotheca gracillima]|nr:MAG: Cytochrome c oxidase subunit 4 [Chaenotheca gracillima]